MMLPTLLRDVLQAQRAPAFEKLLNLWAIEEDAIIGLDLQYTRLFRLKCPDVLYFTADALDGHAAALGRLIDALPEDSTAQLIVRVRWDAGLRVEEYAQALRPAGDMLRFIVQARADFLRKIPFKRVEHFLALTTHPARTDLAKSRLRPLMMKAEPSPSATLARSHAARLEQLKSVCVNALSCLRDAKVAAEPLCGEDIRAFLNERLNPATSRLTPLPPLRSNATLRSQLALNACDARFDTATIDGHHHRAVNLHTQPGVLDGRDLPALLNQIPGDFDLTICVDSINQESAQRDVQRRSTAAAVLANLRFFTRYHEAELAADDADAMLAHVKAASQKIYRLTTHIVLRDVDLKTLTANTDQAIAAFRRVDDAVGVVDDMNHLPLFLASLPGHAHLNPRGHIVPTEVAARFLTQSASFNGCPNPQFITPADDGKLLGVDLFSSELTTKHGLILGVSGEGKSVLTNAILTSFYCADEDNHVIVIDDGGSYRRLCGLLGGQYLEPTLDGTYSFNPFVAKEHAFNEAGELDADFVSFITLLVGLMLRRGDLTNNEKSIIQKCVIAAYGNAGGRVPLLSDLREAFGSFAGDEDDVKRARCFYKDLELWTHGTYGRLLNRRSTFDAKGRFIVFDLNKLTQDDLKPVLLLIIKSTIHPKMADKRLRKLIALDEVWKFLRDKAGADLATEWYKTGRRFNGGVLVATQSAEDLLSSAAADAIAHNSSVKWILNIGGGYEKLCALKLTPEEIEAVRGLGKNVDRGRYRKVFLKFGAHSAVIRNQLSPTEYWLYTTDPNDVNRESELKSRHPDWTTPQVLAALAGAGS